MCNDAVFSGVEVLRKALVAYNIRNREQNNKKLNSIRSLEAHYFASGCPWHLKASNDRRMTMHINALTYVRGYGHLKKLLPKF
jgi:hypothetical protein